MWRRRVGLPGACGEVRGNVQQAVLEFTIASGLGSTSGSQACTPSTYLQSYPTAAFTLSLLFLYKPPSVQMIQSKYSIRFQMTSHECVGSFVPFRLCAPHSLKGDAV